MIKPVPFHSDTIRARGTARPTLLVQWPTGADGFYLQMTRGVHLDNYNLVVAAGRTLSAKGVRRLRDVCDKFLKEFGK